MIETNRLLLRSFEEKDLSSFLSYRNDPDIARFQSWPLPFDESLAIAFINEQKIKDIKTHKEGWIQLAIERKEYKALLGDCAVNFIDQKRQAEFGITLQTKYQKKGYAFEALNELFNYLFIELHIHRIIGLVDTENKNSINLMIKLGMRKEAHFYKSYYDQKVQDWRDEYQFSILKS